MYRVIVADDEDIIRKGIVKLVDWTGMDCEIVAECRDGQQVLDFLEQNEADILVTDIKMPKMDGLRLLECLEERKSRCQSVVLTAYSEFSFAQKAIRCGAADYVIKNDFITELPKAVECAKERLKTAAKKRQKEQAAGDDKNVQCYLLETLSLSRALQSPEDVERYGLTGRWYCVCSCEITQHDPELDTDKTVQMLKNFLNTIVNRHTYYIVNVHAAGMTLIISESAQKGLRQQQIISMCAEILRIVEEFMRIDIKFGVSSVVKDVFLLPAAYKESVKALSRSAKSGNEIVLYEEEEKEPQRKNRARLERQGTKVLDAVFSQGEEEIDLLLEEMKQHIIEDRLPFHQVKIKMINLCSAVFRKFGESYISESVELLEDGVYQDIDRSTTLYSLFEIGKDAIRAVSAAAKRQYEKYYLVGQIENYIQENYRQNFTLKDIADAVHISATYVSRLYRNKTGSTITDAINKIRIEHACAFLRNPTYKIYEVAQMVGFEDAAYFTNVFAKYMGQSPSKYRKCSERQ